MKKAEKRLCFLVVVCLGSLLFSFLYSFAQEKITLTTYYPSPYGIYKELRVDQLAVGSGYRQTPLSDGLLIVNGSVGIGTTSPNAMLEIKGGVGVSLLRFETEQPWVFKQTGSGSDAALDLHSTVNSKYFNITSSGNTKVASFYASDSPGARVYLVPDGGRVGIGTTNPQAALEVSGGHTYLDNYLRLKDYDGQGAYSQIISRDGNTMFWTGGVVVGQYSNDALDHIGSGTLLVKNKVGIGITNPQAALQNIGSGTLLVENKVGIGTTNPQAALQVVSGAIMPKVGNNSFRGIYFPRNPGGGSGDEAFIRYYVESGENTKLMIGIDNDSNDDIAFYQYGRQRMTIHGGNVGIGIANPHKKLHVNGNAEVNGNVKVTRDIDANNNSWGSCDWTGWVEVGRGTGSKTQKCPNNRYVAGMKYHKHRDSSGDYDWYSYKLYCCEL